MLFKFISEMIRSALELANKCGLVCVDVEGNSWTKSDTVRNCDADSGKPKNGRVFREDGSEHASPIRTVGCDMVLPLDTKRSCRTNGQAARHAKGAKEHVRR